jgi:hypothetical protein
MAHNGKRFQSKAAFRGRSMVDAISWAGLAAEMTEINKCLRVSGTDRKDTEFSFVGFCVAGILFGLI